MRPGDIIYGGARLAAGGAFSESSDPPKPIDTLYQRAPIAVPPLAAVKRLVQEAGHKINNRLSVALSHTEPGERLGNQEVTEVRQAIFAAAEKLAELMEAVGRLK